MPTRGERASLWGSDAGARRVSAVECGPGLFGGAPRVLKRLTKVRTGKSPCSINCQDERQVWAGHVEQTWTSQGGGEYANGGAAPRPLGNRKRRAEVGVVLPNEPQDLVAGDRARAPVRRPSAQPMAQGCRSILPEPLLPRPASATGARGDGPTPRASYRTGRRYQSAERLASSTDAAFSPRCASGRLPASARRGKGLPFRVATDGENVSGNFTGTVRLSSGKFAVVEQSHEFTLVPWRPVIDR